MVEPQVQNNIVTIFLRLKNTSSSGSLLKNIEFRIPDGSKVQLVDEVGYTSDLNLLFFIVLSVTYKL